MTTNISLAQAQAMIERARAHAEGIGVPMNIAVVDGGGYLIAFARMDRAIRGSIEIALTKAKTSILFNGPSENLWEFCKPGGPAPGDRAHQRRPDPLRRRGARHRRARRANRRDRGLRRAARPRRRGRPCRPGQPGMTRVLRHLHHTH